MLNYAFRFVFKLLLYIVLVNALYLASVFFDISFRHPLAKDEQHQVVIESGMTLNALASQLYLQGLARHPSYFKIAYLSQFPTRPIQAGLFTITDQDTLTSIAEKIALGKITYETVALIEGWGWYKVQEVLAYRNRFRLHSVSELIAYLSARFPNHLWGNLHSLEGVLMPDTYRFSRGINDYDLLALAFKAQNHFMESQWPNRAPNLEFSTPYEALIVASIIERESQHPDEYAKISGVIQNRLKYNMPLQIDATVLYAKGVHQNKLSLRDLQHSSPYNTYRHKGLPPTPIAMPSQRAIYAALHPYNFSALFYVLDAQAPTRHVFTNTFESHRKAKYNHKNSQPLS